MATRLTGTAVKGKETRAAVTILSQGQHDIKLRPSTDELRRLLAKVSDGNNLVFSVFLKTDTEVKILCKPKDLIFDPTDPQRVRFDKAVIANGGNLAVITGSFFNQADGWIRITHIL